MKQTLLFYTFILSCFISFAQAPEKMSYQAIIRDAGNAIVPSATIGMQISILKETASGTAVYVETQTPTTNVNGLISIKIGEGSVVSGTFSAIDWSNDDYYIKTETDPAGGTNYTITGTSQLLSVPYALHAKNVKSGVYSSIDGAIDFQFNSNNQWHQFADLTTSITLDNASEVLITYNTTSTSSSNGNYLATRLIINGSEPYKMFRSTQGANGVQYFNNSASGVVSLGAGIHTISVEYRTNMPTSTENNGVASSDFMGRGLTVKELK